MHRHFSGLTLMCAESGLEPGFLAYVNIYVVETHLAVSTVLEKEFLPGAALLKYFRKLLFVDTQECTVRVDDVGPI